MVTAGPATAEPAPSSAFSIGIELPSQVPYPAPLKTALRDMGINYVNFYTHNEAPGELPAPDVARAMIDVCDELGLSYSLSAHHADIPADVIELAARRGAGTGRFRGIVFDELEHVRLLWPYSSHLLAETSSCRTLQEAADLTRTGFASLRARTGPPGTTCTATHIWPVLLHDAARAGFIPCPKICKETYSPVSFAVGLGAALQYGRELWADCDLWLWDLVPGHPPEEFFTNLVFAYMMGADLVYVEGAGYNLRPAGNQGSPFSLANAVFDDSCQLTPHGETLRRFCREFIPSHPRPWTFRDVKPAIAIVRFDDTCHGQRFTQFPDKLFGSANLRSTSDTEAWLGAWNLVTFGATGSDGLTFFKQHMASYDDARPPQTGIVPSYATRPVMSNAHQFFVPLNGVVVYDHTVGYERLKDIPLIIVTGVSLEEKTAGAIARCVDEGAVCAAWGPLAQRSGLVPWNGGTQTHQQGKGRIVVTDNFCAAEVVQQTGLLLGHPDEICYRFADRQLVLRKKTGNAVDVELTDIRD